MNDLRPRMTRIDSNVFCPQNTQNMKPSKWSVGSLEWLDLLDNRFTVVQIKTRLIQRMTDHLKDSYLSGDKICYKMN